jgi:hypothetical protein
MESNDMSKKLNRFDSDEPEPSPKNLIIGNSIPMNENISGHLLQQLGILKSFSVSRIISHEDVKKLHVDKEGKSTKSKKIFQDNLKKYLETSKKDENIPGTIYKKDILEAVEVDQFVKDKINEVFSKHKVVDSMSKEKLLHLSKIATLFASLITKEKLSQQDVSFVIISLVKLLGMDNEDFYEQFFEGEDEDGDDEEDDEDEEGPDFTINDGGDPP